MFEDLAGDPNSKALPTIWQSYSDFLTKVDALEKVDMNGTRNIAMNAICGLSWRPWAVRADPAKRILSVEEIGTFPPIEPSLSPLPDFRHNPARISLG